MRGTAIIFCALFLPGCLTARVGVGARNDTPVEQALKRTGERSFYPVLVPSAGLDVGYAFYYYSGRDNDSGQVNRDDYGVLLAGPSKELIDEGGAWKSASRHSLYLTYSRTWGNERWKEDLGPDYRLDVDRRGFGLEHRYRLAYGVVSSGSGFVLGGVWVFARVAYIKGRFSQLKMLDTSAPRGADDDRWVPVDGYSDFALETEGTEILVGIQLTGAACCLF